MPVRNGWMLCKNVIGQPVLLNLDMCHDIVVVDPENVSTWPASADKTLPYVRVDGHNTVQVSIDVLALLLDAKTV